MCNTPGLGGGSQQGSSEAGVLRAAGTPRQDLLQRNFLTSLIGSDWTKGGGGITGALQARADSPVTYQTPELSSRGLFAEQEAGLRQPFEQAVSQAMSRASGNFAQRGFLRPENIQAIAGSAAQNVAPAFANLYTNLAAQNVNQRTQAPLVQEEMIRQRFSDLLAALGLTQNALGGSSQTSSGVQNSGFLGSLATSAIGAAGQAGTGNLGAKAPGTP